MPFGPCARKEIVIFRRSTAAEVALCCGDMLMWFIELWVRAFSRNECHFLIAPRVICPIYLGLKWRLPNMESLLILLVILSCHFVFGNLCGLCAGMVDDLFVRFSPSKRNQSNCSHLRDISELYVFGSFSKWNYKKVRSRKDSFIDGYGFPVGYLPSCCNI